MKGIRLFIQPHGYIENDLAWNIANPEIATVDRREVKSKWLPFPTFSVLIEHPRVGWILYDTGPHPEVLRRRLPEEAESFFSMLPMRKIFSRKDSSFLF
ncbi:MAG: hypothetical protein ACUVTO_09250 [Candidatus Caldatribacteriaceae bacterium]